MNAKNKLQMLLDYTGENKASLALKVNQGKQTFYDIAKEKIKSFTPEVVKKIKKIYPEINEDFFLFDSPNLILRNFKTDSSIDFFSHIAEPQAKLNPTTKDVMDNLKKIQGNKQIEKSSRVIEDSDLVDAIEIIVPYKGQAGLSSNFYPEEIINEFEKRIVRVKPQHRGVFYTIEVDGRSMPPKIQPGDWFRCEEISSLFWLEPNFFKKDKIYNIWHNERGIVFKRIIYKENDLWCVSDNEDKTEYPDFKLDLKMVSKILEVKTLVKRDY